MHVRRNKTYHAHFRFQTQFLKMPNHDKTKPEVANKKFVCFERPIENLQEELKTNLYKIKMGDRRN